MGRAQIVRLTFATSSGKKEPEADDRELSTRKRQKRPDVHDLFRV